MSRIGKRTRKQHTTTRAQAKRIARGGMPIMSRYAAKRAAKRNHS